jgi:hypothetical protein
VIEGYGCGSEDCYVDSDSNSDSDPEENEKLCVNKCIDEIHYEGKNGKCIIRDCDNVNYEGKDGDSYRCGYYCVYDETITSNKKCKSSCRDHYYNISGICISNNHCESRTPITTTTTRRTNDEEEEEEEEIQRCGNGCYEYISDDRKNDEGIKNNSCVSVCPSEYHVKTESSGICSYVSCEDDPDILETVGEEKTCKYHCIYDENDSSCHNDCTNKKHYEKSGKRCILKPCSIRTSNDSNNRCGSSDCYEDENNSNKCTEICSNSDHYYGNSTTHKCELKNCTDRISTGENINPCGDGDDSCYLDSNSGY